VADSRSTFGKSEDFAKGSLAKGHPAAVYFLLTFAVSWTAALAVAAPHLVRHEPLSQLTGILMFPAMLLGPSLCGVLLTWWNDGKAGVHELFRRIGHWRIPLRWYVLLLLPPVAVLSVLSFLRSAVSPDYSPNFFLLGVLFGVPAGLLEEIGWMGFAFPRLAERLNTLAAGLVLGGMWALWHVPVVNFLGTATPHGSYWFPYFCVFSAAMIAMRVLISWTYTNTQSVLLAQLIHVSSTGSLVIFSPPRASAAEEVRWYGIYAIVLWLCVGAVVAKNGVALRKSGGTAGGVS
jgi:membrane protease YdiL (CAAX protease family)